MAVILSELGKLPGKIALKSKLSKIFSSKSPTPHKKASWHVSPLKTSWIFLGLSITFLLAVLVSMTLSIYQTKQNAAYQEITGRIQLHSQRIAKVSQQTILGHVPAFEQLQDSRNQLDLHLALLMQGGVFREMDITPIDEAPGATMLAAFHQKWLAQDKKINLLLRSQTALVKLAGIVNEINTDNTQLVDLIDQLTMRIEQIGNLPNASLATEAMQVLAQSITKSVNTVLPSEYPVTHVSEQLNKDRERLVMLITALNQGNVGLRISSLQDARALQLLQQIQILYRLIDRHTNIFQKEISAIIATKFSAQKLYQNSEAMLSQLNALESVLEEKNMLAGTTLNFVTYASGALFILVVFFFAKTFNLNIRQQLQASKKEITSTEQALSQLLIDMKKLADGDLTVRTRVAENMTGAIANSINCTIEKLHNLVAGVNRATTQVVEASSQAQHVSSKLLAAAHQQSEDIEDTTVAVLGIAESINEVSATAAESARVAKQSLANAEKGAAAVRDSIAGMNEIRTHIQATSKRIKRLGESSQEIGEIVALIADIAEQTNVLALNAAIQAASAGEAGRGFTVIAQEVQRLAEHSDEATKQIDALVKTIQGDTQETIAAMEKSTSGVTEGAKRSDIAGDALQEIEKVSKQLEKLVTNISDNTDIQARAADQVVRNMEAILQATRQTTQGTTQTTESIKQMTNSASELKASVSNFKV